MSMMTPFTLIILEDGQSVIKSMAIWDWSSFGTELNHLHMQAIGIVKYVENHSIYSGYSKSVNTIPK